MSRNGVYIFSSLIFTTFNGCTVHKCLDVSQEVLEGAIDNCTLANFLNIKDIHIFIEFADIPMFNLSTNKPWFDSSVLKMAVKVGGGRHVQLKS